MPDSSPNGAQLLCEALIAAGVRVIFGIPGGAIMPFYHALPDYPALRHVLCRHEQGAGHAAQGYARSGGGLGVCVATSGPGATNLVTPIADAWMDGTPLLAITGQVGSSVLGTDAFQETDFIGITLPIVKHSFLVSNAREIPSAVADAVDIALSGRPGPVVIDVTKDAQQGRIERHSLPLRVIPPRAKATQLDDPLRRAVDALSRSQQPLILAGQGVLLSGATDELGRFAERLDIPVATTLLGLGAIPQDHPLSLGLAGMHGEVHVNRALQRCDLLLSVGARFDDRVTGRADRFAPNATVIHIDIEPAQIGKTVRTAIELCGDARAVLVRLNDSAPAGKRPVWRAWLASEATSRTLRDRRAQADSATDFPPAVVYRELDAQLGHRSDVRFVTDVGQHQMWAAQLLTWRRPGTHITSGGAGTMGFAVPAALGAALASPNDTIWVVVGDGGFQMTSQELATIAQEGVRNIKIAIINNGYLGMVRQWQQLFQGQRYSGTPLTGPDFSKLARAYGFEALTVERPGQVAPAIARAQDCAETVIIDFRVEREANVFPITPPGAAIDGMIERVEVAT